MNKLLTENFHQTVWWLSSLPDHLQAISGRAALIRLTVSHLAGNASNVAAKVPGLALSGSDRVPDPWGFTTCPRRCCAEWENLWAGSVVSSSSVGGSVQLVTVTLQRWGVARGPDGQTASFCTHYFSPGAFSPKPSSYFSFVKREVTEVEAKCWARPQVVWIWLSSFEERFHILTVTIRRSHADKLSISGESLQRTQTFTSHLKFTLYRRSDAWFTLFDTTLVAICFKWVVRWCELQVFEAHLSFFRQNSKCWTLRFGGHFENSKKTENLTRSPGLCVSLNLEHELHRSCVERKNFTVFQISIVPWQQRIDLQLCIAQGCCSLLSHLQCFTTNLLKLDTLHVRTQ